jgi:hypothetical protein
MKVSSLCAVIALALFGLGSHASAAIVDLTFTGTVISVGYDQSGIFVPGGLAPPSTSLDGASYTANFVFNTALGYSYSSSTESEVYGGTYYGVASPLVSASVTIDGQTANIQGLYDGVIFSCSSSCPSPYGSSALLELYAEDKYIAGSPINGSNVTNYTQVVITGLPGSIPSSITTGTYSSASGFSGTGNVSFFTAPINGNFSPVVDTYFEGSLTDITETVSATPLPSTWLMLLSGFVGLGLVAYAGTKKNVTLAVA